MTSAVVLFSGGLDSTSVLEKAIQDGNETILALSIHYGSLHNNAEGLAAQLLIQIYQTHDQITKIDHEIYQLPKEIFRGTASALMGEIPMPELSYEEIANHEGPSPTVVPFRNANLISIATAIAEARGFNYVYIGAHAEDAKNWAYPDCTPEFLGAMANAIHVGTYHKVALRFPWIWMTKADIVQWAAEMGVPLEYTWSCYSPILTGDEDGPDYTHCGKCPTCKERAYAFALAGFVDPTSYYVGLDAILGDDFDIDDLEDWPDEG